MAYGLKTVKLNAVLSVQSKLTTVKLCPLHD